MNLQDSTSEEYQKKREDVLKMVDNPDFDAFGKTQLNFADAAIAGAKLLVDETVATRSMSKKSAFLHELVIFLALLIIAR